MVSPSLEEGAVNGYQYYPSDKAAKLEFTKTVESKFWRGKYRCIHCKQSGYLWEGCTEYQPWWGHGHGKNCKKRQVNEI
jgi:hypothetical protein